MMLRSHLSWWSFLHTSTLMSAAARPSRKFRRALDDYPSAIVVSDCWSHDSRGQISSLEVNEIVALGRVAPVIVTTGRSWPAHASELPLGERVVVISKPYDVDQLLDAIRVAAERQCEGSRGYGSR